MSATQPTGAAAPDPEKIRDYHHRRDILGEQDRCRCGQKMPCDVLVLLNALDAQAERLARAETATLTQFRALLKICSEVEFRLLVGGGPDKLILQRLCTEGFANELSQRLLAAYHEQRQEVGPEAALAGLEIPRD